MAIEQPQSTDKLNSPDHALQHRIIASDASAPVESLAVDSSGNLGIGTSTPNSTLQVNGSSSVPYAQKTATYSIAATLRN